jgi:hypothetical protein
LQNGSHPAENDRLTQQAIVGAANGVIGGSSYAVTASGSMSVSVAAGYAALIGASTSTQGTYIATNDAATSLTVPTADTTYGRIDIVYLQVNDSFYSGATNSVTLSYLAGSPAVSPTVPVPTGSTTYYILAQVAVASNATSITNANITDRRSPVLTPLTQSATMMSRLTANGTAATGPTFFAHATLANAPYLLAGHTYQVNVSALFLKNTTSGTHTWFLGFTGAAGISGNFQFQDTLGSNLGGVSSSSVTSINATAATGSYSAASTYGLNLVGTITVSTNNGWLSFGALGSAGTTTPLAGSVITVSDLGTVSTIGNIG